MDDLYDRRGIPFRRGDIVKVFHFIGARRKRHFMYHQCLGIRHIGPNAAPYLAFSHLNFVEDHRVPDGPYLERPDGRALNAYEIVQSINCKHEERPRALLAPNTPDGWVGFRLPSENCKAPNGAGHTTADCPGAECRHTGQCQVA